MMTRALCYERSGKSKEKTVTQASHGTVTKTEETKMTSIRWVTAESIWENVILLPSSRATVGCRASRSGEQIAIIERAIKMRQRKSFWVRIGVIIGSFGLAPTPD